MDLGVAAGVICPDATPPPVALYVHFPFCVSVCPYCDFVVYAGRAARGPENKVAQLVEALVTEISLRGRAAQLRSVYLGGGTPSLMTPAQVAHILDAAHQSFGLADGAEVALEVNPGAVDRGDLPGFAAAGVNRVSIGAQSMNASDLRRLGRRHSPADVATTVTDARRAGMLSVSVDVLYDLPGQTISSWEASVNATLALEPDHVSAYALTLEAGDISDDHLGPTRGAAQWRSRARLRQDEDRAADMYELADEMLGSSGLYWYEISNWSRPGHESRHNLAYWMNDAWEAVGPGAHAFDGVRTRRWNAARLDTYVAALAAGALPAGAARTSTDEDATAERTILRLRTSSGVESSQLGTVAEWGIQNRLLERTGRDVQLTRRGRLVSNELFVRLMADGHEAIA